MTALPTHRPAHWSLVISQEKRSRSIKANTDVLPLCCASGQLTDTNQVIHGLKTTGDATNQVTLEKGPRIISLSIIGLWQFAQWAI